MHCHVRTISALLLAVAFLSFVAAPAVADTGESTRIAEGDVRGRTLSGGYPYREKADYVLQELDLKKGDVVVDIGAGDGFWSARMADAVGEEGVVHAGEVSQKLVDQMKKLAENKPQWKPYLCPTDGTGLDENSCDLAFLSKTFHHLPEDKVAYWKHLHGVLAPHGRVVVIEHYPALAEGRAKEHAWPPGKLINEAEEGGWVCMRYELMRGTHHFIAVFAKQEAFQPPQSK